MAEKGNYCKGECGGRKGCGDKAEQLEQMRKYDKPLTDVNDPGTHTEELYPLKQRAP